MYANWSAKETDAQILRYIIHIIFYVVSRVESSVKVYADLCKEMMIKLAEDFVDINLFDQNGKPLSGPTLFREYVINLSENVLDRLWGLVSLSFLPAETLTSAGFTVSTNNFEILHTSSASKTLICLYVVGTT